MHAAMHSLDLSRLWIVYPGKDEYELDCNISVIPLPAIANLARTL
jgi:hypothetical protein